ncbi:ABC transporter substrate-binding protein [Reinekea blandensis]|uniref:ABC-type sugar transport system, periplasmic component n=1 Tax=Reinekea blandensis MED297 TaxID=314283 RepID=A4BA63_9GAMM|nr:ABC transporter substrate-binding protein [Reinekea blandensis]EAR10819.1 ABC-type sugar transport system, periplasmic component [Reinekea sp. MED297] [Reinekea blandensis MED297]
MMNTIKTKLISAAVVLVFASSATTQAMNLVMATDEENRNVLQSTIGLRTNDQWNVLAYQGTDLQMVDEIRQQAVTSNLPNAAQIPGATIRRWAALGFINNLDDAARQHQWSSRLPQTIREDISFQDNLFAVPTQIHRSNWMWMNGNALNVGNKTMPAPKTWKAFFDFMDGGASGQRHLITVDDPAQYTLILESILLGLKGSAFYQSTFKDFDYRQLKSDDMVDVFRMMARLRPLLNEHQYPDWESAAKALANGEGQVLFAGDWIKPMFVDTNGNLPEQLVCAPFPEASAKFLYNLNSVVMFRDTDELNSDIMAKLLFTETVLTDLNLREGSIPARLDISPYGFDRCAVRAMREFRSSHTTNTLQPSLAAGMAAPEGVQKSVYDAVNEFVADTSMTPEEGAKNLAKAIRIALYKI